MDPPAFYASPVRLEPLFAGPGSSTRSASLFRTRAAFRSRLAAARQRAEPSRFPRRAGEGAHSAHGARQAGERSVSPGTRERSVTLVALLTPRALPNSSAPPVRSSYSATNSMTASRTACAIVWWFSWATRRSAARSPVVTHIQMRAQARAPSTRRGRSAGDAAVSSERPARRDSGGSGGIPVAQPVRRRGSAGKPLDFLRDDGPAVVAFRLLIWIARPTVRDAVSTDGGR